jgi:hypothetical protein
MSSTLGPGRTDFGLSSSGGDDKVAAQKEEGGSMLRWVTILAVLGAGGAATAAEVLESAFQVEFTRNGESATNTDTVVPYLPDAACYYWYLKFDPTAKAALTLVETLSLPEPLAAWKDYQNDPSSGTQIGADAQSAVTTITEAPDADGWLSHGWCVAEGDPLGAHNISVTLDGTQIASWDFTVVAEADYPFAPQDPQAPAEESPVAPVPDPPSPPAPPPQPSPTARDVNQSW